jgi:hypothetical protein
MRHAVLLLLAVAISTGCSVRPKNEVREVLLSPDGKQKLVVFCRDAGATTGFNTQMSVVEIKEELPNDGGNALIVDHGRATAAWKQDGSLLVTLDRNCRVFKKETLVRGTAIEYREQ